MGRVGGVDTLDVSGDDDEESIRVLGSAEESVEVSLLHSL